MQINTIIIEDIGIEAAGIKTFVLENNNVLAIFETSQEFFKNYKKYENDVDIILIDYDLHNTGSELNGDEIIKRLTEENYSTKCAIVTNFDDFEYIVLAKKSGALGFSSKNIKPIQYSKFLADLYNTDEFIVEQSTKDKVFKKLLVQKHIDIMPENYGFTDKHIKLVKALIVGKKTDEIIAEVLKDEFLTKLQKYSYKNNTATSLDLNSFLGFIQKQKVKLSTSNVKQNEINFEKKLQKIDIVINNIEKIINSDIDKLEKYDKIFTSKYAPVFFRKKIVVFYKLKDNLLTTIKRNIQTQLNLPNFRKEIIIAAFISKGLISKEEIEHLLKKQNN